MLCTVSGFMNRAQCLSFEWRVKRAPAGFRIPPKDRRAQQIAAVVGDERWWKRFPPRPDTLQVEWNDSDPEHTPVGIQEALARYNAIEPPASEILLGL